MANAVKRCRVSMTLPNGKRMYFDGKTKKEAEKKREQAKLKVAGGWDIGNTVTFEQMAEEWLDEYKSQKKLHDRTKETTEAIFRRYLIPEFGKMRIRDIKPAHIDLMLKHHSDLSSSTQKKMLTYAGKIFDKAIENEIIPRSPTTNKKPTAEAPEKVLPLTDDQCRALLKATKGTRVYPFVLVLMYCGLRKGEALALMWKDLDFENNLMTVDRSLVYLDSNKAGEINRKMKTASSHRVIPMAPEVVEELKRLKRITNSVYVFSMRDGSFLSEASFRSMWKLIDYRRIGGPSTGDYIEKTLDFSVHPHQLRHTCCTRWINSGLSVKEVQYLMGHATADMTMNVYADYIASQQLASTAEKITSGAMRLSV